MPLRSRFQNSLNDLHRKNLLATPYAVITVLTAILFFAVFLAEAAAQGRRDIANIAKQRVNASAARQQPQTPAEPNPEQQPPIGVPARVVMPDLVSPGFTYERAEAELKERKTTVDDRREEYSSDVPAGRLVAQYPKAGTPLTSDPNIILIVSKGPDPSLSTADLSVEVTLQTKEPFSEGQPVQYTILIKNLGRVAATNVRVTAAPKNLTIDRSSTPCTDLNTCNIPSIDPNKPVTINVTATILRAGDFDNIVTVKGTETDPDPANNIDFAGNGGTVAIRTPDPPSNGPTNPEPFPWEWVLLGTGGGLITGGIITKAVSRPPRPRLQPDRTSREPTNDMSTGPTAPSIDTYVDLETGASYCDPFPINGPPLSLDVELELGQMWVEEHIAILKEEIVNE